MNKGEILRDLLIKETTITLPGVYDCISAIAAENAGFKCLFTSGFGIAATAYGKPDYGIISSTEMINVIKKIAMNQGCFIVFLRILTSVTG